MTFQTTFGGGGINNAALPAFGGGGGNAIFGANATPSFDFGGAG